MMIEFLFIASFLLYLLYAIYEYRRYNFDDSLLRYLGNISISLKKGIAFRPAVEKLYVAKDPASELMKRILQKSERNDIPIAEAIKSCENYCGSQIMKTFARLVELHFVSKADIGAELQDLAFSVQTVKRSAQTFHHQNYLAIRVIQLLTIVAIPSMILFLSDILQIQPFIWNFYFMGFTVVVYSAMDYTIFGNWKKSIVIAPFFFMTYLMAITTLYGYVSWFFMGFG